MARLPVSAALSLIGVLTGFQRLMETHLTHDELSVDGSTMTYRDGPHCRHPETTVGLNGVIRMARRELPPARRAPQSILTPDSIILLMKSGHHELIDIHLQGKSASMDDFQIAPFHADGLAWQSRRECRSMLDTYPELLQKASSCVYVIDVT